MNLHNSNRPLPRLLQLLNQKDQAPRNLEVRQDGDTATIYLYDAIDPFWGVGAAAFVKELAALTVPTVHLRINSPGGDVFEARAMATALKGYSGKVIAHIDGICASAATYVALACGEVEITEGGFFMIHKAWALTYGNSDEMRQLADLLDKVDASISNDYQKKTGKKADEIAVLMKAETWFTAEEALENGFVDRIFTGEAVENRWNLSAYAKAPKALTEEPQQPIVDHSRVESERRLSFYQQT